MPILQKYQWYAASLKKKSQTYDWLMLGCAGVALVSRLLWENISGWLLLAFLAGAIVFFILSWRIKNQDVRLKTANKTKIERINK